MLKKKRLWVGLASLFCTLLSLTIIVTDVAFKYEGVVNNLFNIGSTAEIPSDGSTEYYKSSFGEKNSTNQRKLVEATMRQTANEMREGAALLKNDNVLPLKNEKRISVFGHAAVEPMYQGSSAGTKVNNDSFNVVTLDKALEKQGFEINASLWNALNDGKARRPIMRGGGTTAKGTEENQAFYEGQRSSWQNDYNDAAIVVFAREGGEGYDITMNDIDDEGGSSSTISGLALHKNERDLLQLVRQDFDKVIVLLNSPYPMEVREIEEYCDAILYIGSPGHQGFLGVAEILRGEVNPSGHLTDTYATNSLSAPATINSGTNTPKFSNESEINSAIGNEENGTYISFQAEGIYVGYRYYETRYADCVYNQGDASNAVGASFGAVNWNYENEVSYPFGYGLSYTTFEQRLIKMVERGSEVEFTVGVKNTGNVPGKSVVQVYAQTPYGEYEKEHNIEKSAIQLAGFTKTKELDSQQEEVVTIVVDKYLLASYDYTVNKGYVLTPGDYYFAIGDNAHDALNNILASQGYSIEDGMTSDGDADKADYYTLNEANTEKYALGENGEKVTNRFDDCDLNYWYEDDIATYLSRSDWKGTYPIKQTTPQATKEMIEFLDGDFYVKPENAPSYDEVASRFGVDKGYNFVSMRDVPLNDKELWEEYIYQLDIEQLPEALAEDFTSPAVGEISPEFKIGDGCDSIGTQLPFRQDGKTVEATRYCSKSILTGTFNVELYAERGRLMGEEGLWSGTMQNYNVGANLHRTPFGGRNYEYMSECPVLSYLASIPEVEAMEKTGSHAAPKHFTGNDQEFQREGVACFFNEQAFREGNLRAFEGALRVAKAGGLMQSYERLGVRWCSASYALNTEVLRNEWNFEGNVVTDAAMMVSANDEGNGYLNHSREALAAGSQQWCMDFTATHGNALLKLAKDTDDGYIIEKMIDAAISWQYAISRSVVCNGYKPGERIETPTPWWQTALYCAIGVFATLSLSSCALLVISMVKNRKEEENEN